MIRKLIVTGTALVALTACQDPRIDIGGAAYLERDLPWKVTLYDGTCFVTDYDRALSILDENAGVMISDDSCVEE